MPNDKQLPRYEHTIDGFTHVIDVLPHGMDPLEAMAQIHRDCPHCQASSRDSSGKRPRWRDVKRRAGRIAR